MVFTDAMRKMPVVLQEPGRHLGDVPSKPFAITEGQEPVLPAVQKDGNEGDGPVQHNQN